MLGNSFMKGDVQEQSVNVIYEIVAPHAGIEPATYRLGGDCSVRLN